MADIDVFGILSLLLAAAGAAYLVWTRVLRPGAMHGANDASGSPLDDRPSDAMPPALQPESETPPEVLARTRSASARPAPISESSAVPHGASGANEAPPIELATIESSKHEPARVEAPKHEPARVESPKHEPARVESPKHEPARVESPKHEPARVESSKHEPARGESSKHEPAHVEASSSDILAAAGLLELPEEEAIQPSVEKIVVDDGADIAGAGGTSSRLAVRVFAQTVPGKRRKRNEDSVLVLEQESVFLVADGMGVEGTGELASKLVVKIIGDAFTRRRFDAAAHEDIPLPASELARSIQMANAAVFHAATKRPELKGMGSTLCAARFTEDMQRLYVGHVGDSRCYRIRDGVMKQLTTDHTMSDYGVAGPEGAHLSRALGVWPAVAVDVIMAAPALGDVYLICSDGLTKVIPDGTIATQLLHEEDPRAAVERLVFFANAHGSKDDVSVILLRIVEAGRTSSRPS